MLRIDKDRGRLAPLIPHRSLSLKSKLMLSLIPSVVLVLGITGYITHAFSSRFIETALTRNARLHTLAMAHEVEHYLEDRRRDLLFIAQGELSAESMRDYLARNERSGGMRYCELLYIAPEGEGHVLLSINDGDILQVPRDRFADVRPNPFLLYEEVEDLKPGEVRVLPVQMAEYPFPVPENHNRLVSTNLIRLVTPVQAPTGAARGLVSLAVDARQARNILSLFNSPRSPIYAVPRTDELRFAYLVSTDGWILFQSESVDEPDAELSTFLARADFDGTLSMPGLDCAFRPSALSTPFWRMIADVNQGLQDCLVLEEPDKSARDVDTHFFAYAPVHFTESPDRPAVIYAALAYVDRSKLTLSAGYKQLDVMFIITLSSIAAISLLLILLSRAIANPILRLAKSMRDLDLAQPEEIPSPSSGYEISLLTTAVNSLISKMNEQVDLIRYKDLEIHAASLEQRADLGEWPAPAPGSAPDSLPAILGFGPKIDALKSDILKAAQADVDVLIIGETGTGKQLAAEAIHAQSKRKAAEFISINCGALDENLLLDTLFGHTKGAFTEARTDRKGAFLEAHGGTLFLDEIQSASLKVQQSLLRTISMRKIKPLGSDKEIDVNVRLIAATNADLPRMIEERRFREDLYFRLKVLSLHTPPLREHRESIPALALHYLRHAEQLTGKRNLALSKGVLAKMQAYRWPGNVRELVNCITRAAVMVEGDLIHARDIRLEGDGALGAPSGDTGPSALLRGDRSPQAPDRGTEERPPSAPPAPARNSAPPRPLGKARGTAELKLSPRQRKAWPVIVARGEITRGEYQETVGGDLPSRTAIYDLNDMVGKGVLTKIGSGPATRYALTGTAKNS